MFDGLLSQVGMFAPIVGIIIAVFVILMFIFGSFGDKAQKSGTMHKKDQQKKHRR